MQTAQFVVRCRTIAVTFSRILILYWFIMSS